MTEVKTRDILAQTSQSLITQQQAMTVQAQDMTAQSNQDVAPRPHQKITAMASRLRDFTQMNPPTIYGSKIYEDPKEFLDEVYKQIYAMRVTSSEKV